MTKKEAMEKVKQTEALNPGRKFKVVEVDYMGVKVTAQDIAAGSPRGNWDVTPDLVAERVASIDKEILRLIEEQWNLVNPTTQEIDDIIECHELDRELDFIADPTVPIGKWFLAGEAMEYREMTQDDED